MSGSPLERIAVLAPRAFKVRKTPMIEIGENEVGIVESIDGSPLDPGRIFARRVEGHDTYQDGAAYLRNGGQKGTQIDVLPPGQYRINTYLFRIRVVPALIVPSGAVGVVTAGAAARRTSPGRRARPP